LGVGVAALPLQRLTAQSAQSVTSSHSAFDPWVEVYIDHLRHNVTQIQRHVASRPIMAVIKNNGYGLGVTNVGRVLDTESAVGGMAVVKLHEAIALRDAGVTKPVLLMGPFDDDNLEDAVDRDITPMVYTPVGDVLDRVATRRQQPTSVHIGLDSGMGRVGVPYDDADAFIRDLARRPTVKIEGLMTTLSEDPELDVEQLRRLLTVTDALRRDGVDIGRRHAASSFGLFHHRDAFLDMVRPGMAIYGIYSEPQFRTMDLLDLKPALSLKARVAFVKQLPVGGTAGYNKAYVATEPVWVATIPIGHADGWPRIAAAGARVKINGVMYPIIAAVSASHTIVELGREPSVAIGDVATMFDWEEGSRPEDVAESCDSSVYDLTMHLSALMPRRVI
jgi:alanine racemase